MSEEQKGMYAEMRTVWEEMKSALTTRESEIVKLGAASQEQKNYIDALNARIAELELKAKRPYNDIGGKVSGEERKAFIEALRHGRNSLPEEQKSLVTIASPSETKALALTDDTLGGYLAVPEFVNDIIKASLVFSPIRSYANVRKTTNRSVQIPIRKGTFAATWVSETGQRSETTGLKYGREELATSEMYAEVLISNQDLEDSAFDMDAQIQMEASEQFGIAEGTAFVSGSGVGRPEGLLTNTGVTFFANGNTTTLQYVGLVGLMHALKSPYAVNAVWTMTRATVGLVRSMVDTNGRPLWDIGTPYFNAGLVNPNPPTILGRPYFESPDMPTVANGNYPIIFADFNRAYTIVDRVTMVVQRLIEKYAETGQTAYIIRKRVGGQVVLPEAILKLKMA